jgi:hypothetical protein
MRLFLAELASQHGSVSRYVTDYLGAGASLISDLKARYTQDRAASADGPGSATAGTGPARAEPAGTEPA